MLPHPTLAFDANEFMHESSRAFKNTNIDLNQGQFFSNKLFDFSKIYLDWSALSKTLGRSNILRIEKREPPYLNPLKLTTSNSLLLKATFVLCLLNIIALTFFYFQNLERQRIAYVNSATLVNSYQGMVVARKEFQQKMQTWKANIDTLGKEVQEKIFEFEKNGARMTATEKKLSQELIRTKQDQFAQYQQAINAQAKEEETKLTNAVIAEINSYLKKYGEAKGYGIVIAATEYGNIAYGDEALDITNEVLAGLNKEYSGR